MAGIFFIYTRFQTVYDIHIDIHTSTTAEGLIREELDFLVSLVDSDGEKLPSDYEAQYRAWRPESLPAQLNDQQQGQQTNQQTGGPQTQQPSSGQQQQSQAQTSQPSGGTYDPYDGYGSYNAMIDAYCKRYPELSREEIIQRNPDPAGFQVNEAAARADAAEDRLHGG